MMRLRCRRPRTCHRRCAVCSSYAARSPPKSWGSCCPCGAGWGRSSLPRSATSAPAAAPGRSHRRPRRRAGRAGRAVAAPRRCRRPQTGAPTTRCAAPLGWRGPRGRRARRAPCTGIFARQSAPARKRRLGLGLCARAATACRRAAGSGAGASASPARPAPERASRQARTPSSHQSRCLRRGTPRAPRRPRRRWRCAPRLCRSEFPPRESCSAGRRTSYPSATPLWRPRAASARGGQARRKRGAGCAGGAASPCPLPPQRCPRPA
mmetsp:Transcript_37887/g.118732  ORF Transcript_37887/g.118732 Transcript_37887/m.118732 type:complete len:265 (-) Transcript_37887:1622-2416(-)